jgi:hypothetical protein
MNARVVYNSVSNGLIRVDREESGELSLDDLLRHADALNATPDWSTDDTGGNRGFITVHNENCVLHAYFVEDAEIVDGASVQFEFGILTRESADRQPASMTGQLTLAHLNEVLTLLSQDYLPLNYLQAHATVQF